LEKIDHLPMCSQQSKIQLDDRALIQEAHTSKISWCHHGLGKLLVLKLH